MAWGPWSPTCHAAERRPQLRCLQGIIACYHGSSHPLIAMLRAAEVDPEAFVEAQIAIETMPALYLRRVVSMFGAVTWPRSPGRAS